MSKDLVRPSSPGNPACPAERVKAALAGANGAIGGVRGFRRAVLLAVGGLSLVTGVIGMFVPVLPTTCFLLLATWCFGKSSPRLHRWMFSNRWFGAYLHDYQAGRGIPRGVKVGSLAVMWASISLTAAFAVSSPWLRLLLVAIALVVTAHVATQRSSTALGDKSGA